MEIKKIFTKKLIIFLIEILVLFTVAPSEKINAASGNQFKASIVGDKVNLTWKIENDRDYRVYRSLDGRNYDLLGIDGKVYSEQNPIKVFQIIPGNRDNSNTNFHLMNWLRNETLIDARGSYANEWERKGRPRTSDELGKLPVAYFSEFSQRPDFYLKDSAGNWKYDVLFIGGLDAKSTDPDFYFSVEAQVAIINFIESGRGVIFGHDTIAGGDSVLPYQYQFNFVFKDYANIQLNGGENSLKAYHNGSDKIRAVKRGLLTDSKYNIYQLSDSIGIHYSHNVGQQVLTTGDIWYKFDGSNVRSGNDNVYVSTHGNVATIQLGHNEPDRPIPESLFTEEEHLVANLIYYCATVQSVIVPNNVVNITDKTVKLKDDVSPTVDIDEIRSDNNSVDLEISATDRGNTYTYVLAEFSKSQGGGPKYTFSSFEYTSGIQNLYYTADFGKNWESTTNNSINLYINKGTDVKNLHFTASDNSNNITEPYLAYQIDAKTKKQSNLVYVDKKGNEHRVNKVLYKGINDTEFKQIDAYWYYDAKGKKTYKINIDE